MNEDAMDEAREAYADMKRAMCGDDGFECNQYGCPTCDPDVYGDDADSYMDRITPEDA